MPIYIALIRKDEDSDDGVDVPDFPGCVTAGSGLEEVRRRAPEALALHVEGVVKEGHAIPEPSGLDAVMADPHSHDAVAFLVEVTTRRS